MGEPSNGINRETRRVGEFAGECKHLTAVQGGCT